MDGWMEEEFARFVAAAADLLLKSQGRDQDWQRLDSILPFRLLVADPNFFYSFFLFGLTPAQAYRLVLAPPFSSFFLLFSRRLKE
jgi:hypothetical protein